MERKEGDEIRVGYRCQRWTRRWRRRKKREEKKRDEKGEDRNWRTRRRRIAGNVTHVYIYMHLFICNTRVCVRMHDEYIRGVSLALLRLITT